MDKNLIEKLLPLWNMSQRELASVVRWGSFVEENPKLWKQPTLHHTLSFSIVASVCVQLLKKHIRLDEGLLQLAFNIHDLGEGLTRRDISVGKKQDKDDLEEYEALKKSFSFLSPKDFRPLQKAFLLQFARRNPDCFDQYERNLMRQLMKSSKNEVLVFNALESWEYIFYPLEMYIQGLDDGGLLFIVLSNQLDKLKMFSRELKGFRQEIFTKSFEEWAEDFVLNHKVSNQVF